MIPKLDISTPELLVRCFYFKKDYGSFAKFEEDVKNFTDFLETHQEKILAEIEKLSGFLWAKERIPVYLVPAGSLTPPSFTKWDLQNETPGVFQKIGYARGLALTFAIHIHELVHVNQMHANFFEAPSGFGITREGVKNMDLSELMADMVVIGAIRNIFGLESEYENEYMRFLSIANPRTQRHVDILNKYVEVWDVNKQSFKSYLEQTPREELENLL